MERGLEPQLDYSCAPNEGPDLLSCLRSNLLLKSSCIRYSTSVKATVPCLSKTVGPRRIQALWISQHKWPRTYGSHRGHASPMPYTHGNAAKSFHSIPTTAFSQSPLEQRLLRDMKACPYCCCSPVWPGTTRLLVPGAWSACSTWLFGPYEVMENFP